MLIPYCQNKDLKTDTEIRKTDQELLNMLNKYNKNRDEEMVNRWNRRMLWEEISDRERDLKEVIGEAFCHSLLESDGK